MKFVGFDKFHDSKIVPNIYIESSNSNKIIANCLDTLTIEGMLKYLNAGLILFEPTLWVFDRDGNSVGGYKIQTDGVWIWPSHYPFYIKTSSKEVPIEFLSHIRNNGFKIPEVSNTQFQDIKNNLLIDLMNRY
jgi:hypothetical protein